MKSISQECKKNIQLLYSQGFSLRKIADRLGVSRETVRRNLDQEELEGKNKSPGRPLKLSPRVKKSLVRSYEAGKLLSSTEGKNHLLIKANITVSRSTVRRTLLRSGLKSYAKPKKPRLTAKHKRARLNFAKLHFDKSEEDWRRVIFSDESKYNLYGPDGHKKVWRRPGSLLLDHHIRKVVKFGGGSVMVWGCITYQGVGQLTFIDSSMNADLYINILDVCLGKTCEVFSLNLENLIFQHDNDPKHMSKATKVFMSASKIDVMEWPSNSPDMNPIEHVWDDVDKRIRQVACPPSNIQELRDLINTIWYSTPLTYIQSLYDSMPRRICCLKRARGGYPKY